MQSYTMCEYNYKLGYSIAYQNKKSKQLCCYCVRTTRCCRIGRASLFFFLLFFFADV